MGKESGGGLVSFVLNPTRVKPAKGPKSLFFELQTIFNSSKNEFILFQAPYVLLVVLTLFTAVVGLDKEDQLMLLIDQTVSVQSVKNIFLIGKYSIMETPLQLLY